MYLFVLTGTFKMAEVPQVDEFAVVKEKLESLFTAIQAEPHGIYKMDTLMKKDITPAANKIDIIAPMNGNPAKICTVYIKDHKSFKRGDVVMASPNQKSVAFNLLMEDTTYMFTFVSKFDATKGLCEKTDFRKGYEYAMSKQQENAHGKQAEMDKLVSALTDIGKIVSDNVSVKTETEIPPNSPAS